MGFRKTAVALTVLALALAATGCKARERYLNAREAYDASRPLICYEDFGRYHFDAGWVEDGSEDPASHSYCLAEDIDNPDRPYTVTVTYDETDDSHGSRRLLGNEEGHGRMHPAVGCPGGNALLHVCREDRQEAGRDLCGFRHAVYGQEDRMCASGTEQ